MMTHWCNNYYNNDNKYRAEYRDLPMELVNRLISLICRSMRYDIKFKSSDDKS